MSIRTNCHAKRSQRGFTLIEALVGAVVLSVGLLSIASLQIATMNNVGDSKARSEAMQIAEAQMESLRSWYSDRDDFNNLDDTFDGQSVVLDGPGTALPDGTTTDYVGTNAEYTIQWEVDVADSDASGAPLLFLAGVRVSWQGSTDGQGEEQAVTVASFLNWDNPAGGAAASDAGDPNGGGTLLSPPTGRAFQGGNVYQDGDGNADLPDDLDPNTDTNTIDIGGVNYDDGTYTYDANGATELIGEDGRVLLTIPTGEQFSTISGMFYSTESVDSSTFEITASDASACVRITLDGNGANIANDSDDYDVEEYYRCYVGPAWYGNIGVVRFGNAANNDRVCVGRPGYAEVARWDSLHPALSTVRAYRGFKDRDPDSDTDLPISTGIGIDPTADPEDGYTPQNYVNHDFLLTNFGGNPSADDCVTALGENATLYDDSWGEGFCFTGSAEDDSGYCPDLNGGADLTGSTTIIINITHDQNGNNNKFINNAVTSNNLDNLISLAGGTCLDETVNQNNYATVECTVSREGFTGETWSDTMIFQDFQNNYGLCTPLGDRSPATGGTIEITTDNTVEFSDIPLSFESLTQAVTIQAGCP
ncbi:prepilin-type N-terminal cleavage/methylation domain-containing protein [Guyparkeria sp. 1SP6A2]|nr:prepilin-type N-terminal cleavage/methylation domain-containing protein [Guyparkeria sp. 1SP6A2]